LLLPQRDPFRIIDKETQPKSVSLLNYLSIAETFLVICERYENFQWGTVIIFADEIIRYNKVYVAFRVIEGLKFETQLEVEN
jgi:hypothetical protein